MSLSSKILKHAEDQYRALLNKSVSKRKYRPAPKLVEMFNFKSDESNQGFGFVLYKNLIKHAWHPVTDYNGHKIVVWDVAFMCCDFVDNNYELHIGNRLGSGIAKLKRFKTSYERQCYMEDIQIAFNENNRMNSQKTPKPMLRSKLVMMKNTTCMPMITVSCVYNWLTSSQGIQNRLLQES